MGTERPQDGLAETTAVSRAADQEPLSGHDIEEALQALSTDEAERQAQGDLHPWGLDVETDSVASELVGTGITQLNPELGPMDLGYPLLVDLGAGEAPYDDGVRTIHGVELTRSGFSDSVLQASWREPWSIDTMLQVTVAFSRYQDLGIMDGLEETSFAWCVVGWKTSL